MNKPQPGILESQRKERFNQPVGSVTRVDVIVRGAGAEGVYAKTNFCERDPAQSDKKKK